MALRLRPHQEQILDVLAEEDRYALLWDMRTGKTLPALIDATDKLLSGEADNWLWIAPLSALGAVQHNARLLSEERQRVIREKMTCINYDKLSRNGSKWQKEIAAVKWDGITLDEGHKIKNPTSNVSKFILGSKKKPGICRGVRFRRFLTGTPVSNSHFENFWCMLSFLDDDYMGYAMFQSLYCITKNIPGTYVQRIVGYRMTEYILRDVAKCSSVVRLEDVSNAPEDNEDYIIHVPWSERKNPSPFDATTKELYDQVVDSYLDALDMVMDNPMARMSRLRMIASGSVTSDEGLLYPLYSNKVATTLDTLESFDGKVVVFHFFKVSGDSLCRALAEKKIPFKQLNGRTPQAEKQQVWRDFQDDPECKVFVSQINSGGTGIDLYTADMIIFMEPCLSSVDLEQARKRISDVNATVAKSFVFLLTEDSIEEDIYARLKNHEGFTDKMFKAMMIDKALDAGKITDEQASEMREVNDLG